MTVSTPNHSLFTLPRQWGDWRLVNAHWIEHKKSGYYIDLWRINDHRELVDWFTHLGGKSDCYSPSDGMIALSQVMHAAGHMREFSGKELARQYWASSN